MLTYQGINENFRALINHYNHAMRLFLDPRTGNETRKKVFCNVVEQLRSIYEHAVDNWLDESRLSRDNTGHIGLVHYREILANFTAIRQIVTAPNFPPLPTASRQILGQIDELITNLHRIILNRENTLNRTLKNTILQKMEIGAGVLFLAGLAIAGAGAITYASGTAFCSAPVATAGVPTVKAGVATTGGGGCVRVLVHTLEEREPSEIRPFV